jgi:hypothetical protein
VRVELVACVPSRGARERLARLEVAQSTLVCVCQLVGQEWVEATLVEGELDEAALGGVQIERL